jgi:hypothetical protein
MSPSAATDAADLLRRLLRQADTKAADLVLHLHPDWVAAAWQHAGPAAARQAPRVPRPRQSALLAQVYGLQWPALADLHPAAHRLALVERPQIVRALATAALFARRERVRRSIGRDVRRVLVDCVGDTAYRQMLGSPAQGPGCNQQPLAVTDLDPDRLAVAGYRALCAQGAWTCRRALAITRLTLAPAALDSAQQHAHRTSRSAEAADAMGVLHRLPDFFPELAWLFGSDMDRALSA